MPKRPGEKEIDKACQTKDAWLTFIGHVETPYETPKDCPRSGANSEDEAFLRLKPDYLPGLKSVETCSHLIVLYWMDQAMRTLIEQAPRFDTRSHGTFALRSPHRPNPIAMSTVELITVLPDGLKIRHIDCVNGTPLLDIKPYFAHSDCVPDATVGWFSARQQRS
nr:tRNA (N6-threonylcarbamoyladenosine(37)-N6)-methyltransferase TrmO [uncultured Cohaesibacter sp.]